VPEIAGLRRATASASTNTLVVFPVDVNQWNALRKTEGLVRSHSVIRVKRSSRATTRRRHSIMFITNWRNRFRSPLSAALQAFRWPTAKQRILTCG
jgi:hypothetical protein